MAKKQGPRSLRSRVKCNFRILGSQGPASCIHFRILGSQGPMSSIRFRILGSPYQSVPHVKITHFRQPLGFKTRPTSSIPFQDPGLLRSHVRYTFTQVSEFPRSHPNLLNFRIQSHRRYPQPRVLKNTFLASSRSTRRPKRNPRKVWHQPE